MEKKLAMTIRVQELKPAGVYSFRERYGSIEPPTRINIFESEDGKLWMLDESIQVDGKVQGYHPSDVSIYVSAGITESSQYFIREYDPNAPHI